MYLWGRSNDFPGTLLHFTLLPKGEGYMIHLWKILRTCTVIALPILISSCAKTLSRDDAAKLIAASNNFQQLRSSILFRVQWDQTANSEGVITSYSGFYCTVTDPRLLAMLTSANCNSFTANLRQPVTTPSIEVTGVTDAVPPANSAKIKEVQFSWTYHNVPGPLNRFIVSGGTGRALIRLYDDGWRLENLDLSPNINTSYGLSEAEKAEAQQQMAIRQEELNREAERAQLEAARVGAEQERVTVIIGNSKTNTGQPIGSFALQSRNKAEVISVFNTGIQLPFIQPVPGGAYFWFGNFYSISPVGTRGTRPGFIAAEDYPCVSWLTRNGKDGSEGGGLASIGLYSPCFEDDATRDNFVSTVIDTFNKWRMQFPEAY